VRFLFQQAAPERALRQPAPSCVPQLQNSSISARYRAARLGGDFYDFLTTPAGRLIFVLLDIAGKREGALDIAATVQDWFHEQAPALFADLDLNESDALTQLTVGMNRAILHASEGVRCAPAFLGCYNEAVGTVMYINAGHTPALLKDQDGVTVLGAGGLPLGLFSHATHDGQVVALRPSAALLVVSRGLVESKAGAEEFGMGRLQKLVQTLKYENAQDLCGAVLEAVKKFGEKKKRSSGAENDTTALALVRAATEKALAVGAR
jgi:serine phosphatase RsbU (regulator of sigma subunit)